MNRYDFDGRSVIITGGAKGIGYATAALVLEGGGRVSLWDVDAAALDAAAAALSSRGQVSTRTVDCAEPAAVAAAAEADIAALGRVDAFVANAGIAGIIKNLWEYSDAEWNRLIAQDLNSAFYGCRAIAPHMLENGYGRIVTVSSIAGLEGAANNTAYSAAKAGLIGLTKAFGKELATSGVLVNCVAPSGIDTPLLGDVTEDYLAAVTAKMPMNRLGRPEEVATIICWLASADCSFSTGAVFDASGGRAVY